MGTTNKAQSAPKKQEIVNTETNVNLKDYQGLAKIRDTYHINTKKSEEGSLLFHLKETQRRQTEAKTKGLDVIEFSIEFSYFREGKNSFELLGFMQPVTALKYGLTDRISHAYCMQILNSYSELNYFGMTSQIEVNTNKAKQLSEARKAFLETNQSEKNLHDYLCKIDALFNAPTKDKKTGKLVTPIYGNEVIKTLFEKNLYSLIAWENKQRFNVENIKAVCNKIASSLTENSKLNHAQISYLLDKIDKKEKSILLGSQYKTIEGGTLANELIEKINKAKQAVKETRSNVQTARKEAKEKNQVAK